MMVTLTTEDAMPLAAMLFDLDGTITEPLLDFAAMKREIGIPTDSFILEALEGMSPAEQARAMAVVERHEQQAAETCRLNDGAGPLLEELQRRAIPTGVITRNSAASLAIVLRRHALRFAAAICREHASPKPSPEGIRLALAQLNVSPAEAAYVGDHTIDIRAGRAAGTRTIWVTNGGRLDPPPEPDFEVTSPSEIIALLDVLQES